MKHPRLRSLGCALALSESLVAGLAGAGGIFSDNFESGTLCGWSNAPSDFEVPATTLDEDCDGAVDEPPDTCDDGLPSNGGVAANFAAALDICQATTEGGHDWGLISASLTLADGTGSPADVSRSIRGDFGSANAPLLGSAMAVLATGSAAAPDQTDPAYVAFQSGLDTLTSSGFPYTAMNVIPGGQYFVSIPWPQEPSYTVSVTTSGGGQCGSTSNQPLLYYGSLLAYSPSSLTPHPQTGVISASNLNFNTSPQVSHHLSFTLTPTS